jgi:hypothetical protein
MSYNDSELQFDSSLVLCIEECEDSSYELGNMPTDKVDNVMFIYWNASENTFCIKGKRQNIGKRDYPPYSFCLDTIDLVIDFISSLTSDNIINATLYNYNNIDSQEDVYLLDYEFFESNKDTNYELAGYDGIVLKKSKKRIATFLRMVKEAYNLIL